jgi:hypothetical protein
MEQPSAFVLHLLYHTVNLIDYRAPYGDTHRGVLVAIPLFMLKPYLTIFLNQLVRLYLLVACDTVIPRLFFCDRWAHYINIHRNRRNTRVKCQIAHMTITT